MSADTTPPFQVFRARDAADFAHSGMMESGPVSEPIAAHSQALIEGGMLEGSKLRVLYSRPGGFSLSHAWFKSGFPLPLHSHDSDCLYFILAGSLKLGTEELGPGDGFFVGGNVPYTYVPGPQGVEVLEFRATDSFDIKVLAKNPAWWLKALARLPQDREDWEGQTEPPSGIAIP